MLRLTHLGWTFVLGVSCLATPPLAAQSSSSMFGSSSPSNRSAAGMNSMGSSNFGGSSGALGGSGMSGIGSGFGATGFGAAGQGGTNRGQAGNGTRNQTGANQGNFIGRNIDPNQFIGLNNLTGGNNGQNNNRQSQRGQGNRNGNNFNLQNQTMNNAANTNSVPALRARQKIGFEFTRPQTAALQTQVQTRFSKLTERNAALKNVTFSTEESGVVVLRGEVASASSAKLAEKLVRLEPGVKVVRSELTYPTVTTE